MEHLVTTGIIEQKLSKGRLTVKMTERMAQMFHKAYVADILNTTKEKEMWKVMFASATKHGTS